MTVRGRACYQTLRRLFSFSTTRLCGGHTLPDCKAAAVGGVNQPDDGCWCCFFSNPKTDLLNIIIIIIHLLHSYVHCDLDHCCSKLHNTIFILLPQGGKFSLQKGKFFSQHCWQHCSISKLPPEGMKSLDQGIGGGTFILEEIFTSPVSKLPIYYSLRRPQQITRQTTKQPAPTLQTDNTKTPTGILSVYYEPHKH